MSTLDVQLSFSRATSLIGGATGGLPYQSATSSTVFAPIGSNGFVLTSNGTTATWSAASGITSGAAGQVNTIAANTSAVYFPTFVDANNASSTSEALYTTSSFSINPRGGEVNAVSLILTNNSTGFNLRLGDDAWIGDVDQANTIRITGQQNSTSGYIIFGSSNFTALGRAGTGDLTYGSVRVLLNATTATLTTLTVGASWQGGATGEIRATNEITAYYSSDARLKENIQVISDPIEIVNQIRGVRFDWTDEHIKNRGGEDGFFVRKHDIGVIAQEIEAVLPELVATRDDGYKAVKYEKIVPLLIEVVKAQQQEINQIREELNKLASK
jgi:hypothetical protein